LHIAGDRILESAVTPTSFEIMMMMTTTVTANLLFLSRAIKDEKRGNVAKSKK
jgi:hypothetical protein